MAVMFFRQMKSENIGGLISMAGSCLFILGGDPGGLLVTISFLVSEIILVRYGHRRVGYSFGCLLFAIGDAIAVTTEVARDNQPFQIALALMAVAWLIGAARGPLAWLGHYFANPSLVKTADLLQPITGIATLSLRLPALVTAFIGGNYIGAAAIACWGAADILVGRLQDLYAKIVKI